MAGSKQQNIVVPIPMELNDIIFLTCENVMSSDMRQQGIFPIDAAS